MTLNQGYSYRQQLGPEAIGRTTFEYLVEHFSHSSLAQWLTRLAAGEVLLQGKPADGQEVLRSGDVLIWNRAAWIEEDVPREVAVAYQDKHVLVVVKPSGLPTLPGGGFYVNTLLSLVRNDFPSARPLHRLGRATSGLVMFALDSHSASTLTRSWPSIEKQYQALAQYPAGQASYDIRTPIGIQRHPRLGSVHAAHPEGKPAWSIARRLEVSADDTTLFEVDLHSGRPHQIRIHLASIGHPLVGDPLYDIGGVPKSLQPGLPGDAGYWLHAKRLVFPLPHSGARMEVHAPLPELLRSSGTNPPAA
ncbi:MAG: RluA family pseudouridine synthase [Pirellulaceae bacterium]|nr:RluA family pseudouridine synthase [Pirellulaceae bacterium]